MERQLVGKRPTFHRSKPRTNTYRIMLLMLAIMGALWLNRQVQSGEIKPLLYPTPTPTRQANSYLMEAEAYFAAGKIDDPNTDQDAIDTYRLALLEDPENAQVWAELARIMTYSSSILTSREQRSNRMQEALQAIDRAKEIDPENSDVRAIRAFVLDWSSYYAESEKAEQRMMADALEEAYAAIILEPENALALAYYAEIQLHQQKWLEAEKYAQEAVNRDGNSFDARRVYAKVLEHLGAYNSAIQEYQAAAAINPNMTFIYLQIGVIYRHLASTSNTDDPLYEEALNYFERAVRINEQNGVSDPGPYNSIAKTYTQMGEFFIAARNAEKALSLNPADPTTYGQLGIIYFKARNYESALPALQCAVTSCSIDENLVLERLSKENPNWGVTPAAVEAQPLESIDAAYVYGFYGQTLAYLSRPQENYCARAYPVLAELRNSPYGSDEVIASMVSGSEAICRKLDGSASSP